MEDKEYVIRGDKAFVDERGRIDNYELPEAINWIGMISSKKHTQRANHYHPVQEQKVLLVSGRFISVFRDLGEEAAPLTSHVIEAGDLVVTRPNVAHTMIFLEDAVFLNLVNGEREHENFGKHTIPYNLVDKEQFEGYCRNYKRSCRVCGNTRMQRVISLGNSPLANNLLKKKSEKAEVFPLQMDRCPSCHFCQLSYVVPPEKMFDEYLYVSSTASSFRDHFSKLAERLVAERKLGKDSLVVDIGSNDGIFLKPLQERGIPVLGVDPAKNVCEIAEKAGIKTLCAYFDPAVGQRIVKENGKADVVLSANMFAHADGIESITEGVFGLLKEDGVFIVEVQYLLDTLRDLTFDNIYHEHVSYYTVTSLCAFFERRGYHVVDVEHIKTHGGSIRVSVQRTDKYLEPSVAAFLEKEKKGGIRDVAIYQKFAQGIESKKRRALATLRKLRKEGKRIAGYGAPAKATTVLNYYGIGDDVIEVIIEDNALKQGRFVPGVAIPIVGKEAVTAWPDVIVILAWNYADAIRKNNPDILKKGVKMVTLDELAGNED